MDSVSQFVLGAFVGHKVIGKECGKTALILGGIVGSIPDLDVVFTSLIENSLDRFFWHRGISHSLLFSVVGAVIFSILLFKTAWVKNRGITFKKLYFFFFWCFFTHILLDCCTTWGTQLFYPFTYRVALSNIFIIDPLYTLPFVFAFILFFLKKKWDYSKRNRLINKILVGTTGYLIVGFIFQQLVLSHINDKLSNRYESINVSPTFFNIINWKYTFKIDKKLYGGKASIFDIGKEKLNYTLLGEDEAMWSDLFLQYPRAKEFIKLLKGSYVIEKKQGHLSVLDYRFHYFFDKQDQRYYSTFYYQISQEKDGDFKLLFKSNRHKIRP